MSTTIYYDANADLSIVQNERLAFIGYGNQGAAQAKNLRDSGVSQILIGNRDDAYKDAALGDDFKEPSPQSPSHLLSLLSSKTPQSPQQSPPQHEDSQN